MNIIGLLNHSQDPDVKYSPPVIVVKRELGYVQITRDYDMNQLSYTQWQEELNWFKNIDAIIAGLEVDEETRRKIIKFLCKQINNWYQHYREFKPVSQMNHDGLYVHRGWLHNYYRTIIKDEFHLLNIVLSIDMVDLFIDSALEECRARRQELEMIDTRANF